MGSREEDPFELKLLKMKYSKTSQPGYRRNWRVGKKKNRLRKKKAASRKQHRLRYSEDRLRCLRFTGVGYPQEHPDLLRIEFHLQDS